MHTACRYVHPLSLPTSHGRERYRQLSPTTREDSTTKRKALLTFTAHQMVDDRSLTCTDLDAYILFLPLALIDHHTARVHERNSLDHIAQQPGELRATPLS
jgi:hypothetical protein